MSSYCCNFDYFIGLGGDTGIGLLIVLCPFDKDSICCLSSQISLRLLDVLGFDRGDYLGYFNSGCFIGGISFLKFGLLSVNDGQPILLCRMCYVDCQSFLREFFNSSFKKRFSSYALETQALYLAANYSYFYLISSYFFSNSSLKAFSWASLRMSSPTFSFSSGARSLIVADPTAIIFFLSCIPKLYSQMSVEHIAIAISSLWTVCSLITLKLSIASSKATRPKREATALTTMESVKFLLLRFTLIEIFAIRNSKYKHGLLLSSALITLTNIFSPPLIIFWGWTLGTIPALLIFIPSDMKTSNDGTQDESKPNQHGKAFFYGSYTITTIFASIASALYLYYFSIPKNNTIVLSMGVNIAMDQLIARPLLCLIGSAALSKWQQFHIWVDSCRYEQSTVRVAVDSGCVASSPPKANRSMSPSKVPKCLFFEVKDLALEPKSNLTPRNDQDSVADLIGHNARIFKNPFQTPIRKARSRLSNNTDSSLDVIDVACDQKFKETPQKEQSNDRNSIKVQVLEAIQVKQTAKQHDISIDSIPIPSRGIQQIMIDEMSGTGAHIINIKQKNSGRISGMETFRLDEPSKEATKQVMEDQKKDEQDAEKQQNAEKLQKLSKGQIGSKSPKQQQIEQLPNDPANTSHISQKPPSSLLNQQQLGQSSIQNIIIDDVSQLQPLQTTMKKDEQQHLWQNPCPGIPQDITAIQTKRTSVIKERLIQHDSNDDDNSSYSDDDPRVKEYLEDFHKSRTLDPGMRLQINKEYKPTVEFSQYAGQELQEVDLNSPTKNIKIHLSPRKKDTSPNPVSRPKKKKNKRDIKQLMKLNGNSPYLEYLPNMLNKQIQQHNKRSQPINPHKTRTQSKSKTTRPPLPLKCSIIQVDSNLQNKSPQDMF